MVKVLETLLGSPPTQEVVSVSSNGKKKRRRRRNKNKKNKRRNTRNRIQNRVLTRMTRLSNPGLGAFEQDYINTINDPFEYGGVHLGFGCLVPSVLAFAYSRGSFAANADGSFMVGTMPALGTTGNFTGGSNSGATAAVTWGYGTAANNSNLAIFSLARVISGGLRVRVGMAQTAAPGVMVGWLSSATASTTLSTANTPTQALNLPQGQLAWGSETVQVGWRPRDVADFDFQTIGTTPNSSGQLYVAGTGFPASVTVYYEAIYHIECMTTTTAGVNDPGIGSSTESGFDTLQALAKVLKHASPEVTSTIQQVFNLNSKFGKNLARSARNGFMTLDALNSL